MLILYLQVQSYSWVRYIFSKHKLTLKKKRTEPPLSKKNKLINKIIWSITLPQAKGLKWVGVFYCIWKLKNELLPEFWLKISKQLLFRTSPFFTIIVFHHSYSFLILSLPITQCLLLSFWTLEIQQQNI